jgi:hypothetical protein
VTGTPLWERLCDVVRRGYENMSTSAYPSTPPCSGSRTSHPRNTRTVPFVEFYAVRPAPLMRVLAKECTLPLLLRCVEVQYESWLQAARSRVTQWRRFVRDARRQYPSLRICRLHEESAWVPCNRAAPLQSNSTPPSPLTQAAAMALPCMIFSPMDAVAAECEMSARCCDAVLLFPFPSVTSQVLSQELMHAASPLLRGCCTEGLKVPERSSTDRVGLLLATWLCVAVRRCAAGSAKALQHGAGPSCARRGSLFSPHVASPTPTMEYLPVHLRQLLCLLVSVDVVPGTYEALGTRWSLHGQRFAALYRDVSCSAAASASAISCSALLVAGGGQQRRHSRNLCRRRGASAAAAAAAEAAAARVPQWLTSLLQYPIAVSSLREQRW